MANPKSWYITVTQGWKTIESKKFFDVGLANAFFKEMKEKYPAPYTVTRENY